MARSHCQGACDRRGTVTTSGNTLCDEGNWRACFIQNGETEAHDKNAAAVSRAQIKTAFRSPSTHSDLLQDSPNFRLLGQE